MLGAIPCLTLVMPVCHILKVALTMVNSRPRVLASVFPPVIATFQSSGAVNRLAYKALGTCKMIHVGNLLRGEIFLDCLGKSNIITGTLNNGEQMRLRKEGLRWMQCVKDLASRCWLPG